MSKKINDGLTRQQRYRKRKIEKGQCYWGGCHRKARPSRRYCADHASRESRGIK